MTPPTDEARAAPEQTVEPRTGAGRLMAEVLGPECGDLRGYILAIEREAAAVAAPALDGSHAFPNCLVCDAAVDDPEALEVCQPSPDEPTP